MLSENYNHDYYANQIHLIKKWALNLAAIYLVLFIVVDFYRYSGDSLQQALNARFFFMLVPMMAVLLIFHNQKKLKVSNKTLDWINVLLIVAVGFGHAKIIEIGANNAMFFPRIGLTIVLIYSGLLLALSIKLSILGSATIVAIAAFTYHKTGLSNGEIASLVFFYSVFSSCCIFMNYGFKRTLYANYNLIKVIEQQANSDYLTKLYNRRYFYSQSLNIYKQSVRDNKPLALLLIDLDNFKITNDKLGHKFGDAVLIKVGEILKKYCRRPLDLPARLGGDEFVLLLHDTEINHVKEVCHQIISDIGHIADHVMKQREDVNLGCSIGVSNNGKDDLFNIKMLLEMADKALYHVKQHGKNDFYIADQNLYIESGNTSDFLSII
ncbi:MAG: GGDEF domain-containing protein [Marinicella sp.]